jgi:2'-5' RNA ligase
MHGARRLFFALWPDDAVRHALLHWQTHNLSADVRWQHRADLHLTLHFLGVVEPERIAALSNLGDSIGLDCFGLVLDEIGYWPGPRVLWCGPTSPAAGLGELHRRLGEGLEAQGFAAEKRPYRPHVTLARRVGASADYRPLAPVSWVVSEWALVASGPGPAPLYEPLRRWALT